MNINEFYQEITLFYKKDEKKQIYIISPPIENLINKNNTLNIKLQKINSFWPHFSSEFFSISFQLNLYKCDYNQF